MKVHHMLLKPSIISTLAVCLLGVSGLLQTASAQTSSRAQTKTKANQMATGIIAAEAALTPEQISLAERVHVGSVRCELGNQVALLADAKSPGYFNLTTGKQRFRMMPVATTTGAIRLEDKRLGGVWLQLANKSMLLNEKQGQRLADDCVSPAQQAVADAMKANPSASVLDAPAAK